MFSVLQMLGGLAHVQLEDEMRLAEIHCNAESTHEQGHVPHPPICARDYMSFPEPLNGASPPHQQLCVVSVARY